MVGVIVNTKSEVLRLSSSRFKRLPLWVGCYELTIDICKLAEEHEHKDNEVLRQLSRAAVAIPGSLAKCSSYRIGRNYVRNLREACVNTRELALLLLVGYELDYISSEKFADFNSRLGKFSKSLFRYTKRCENKVRRRKRAFKNK